MITVIESPQRCDFHTISYVINQTEDVLSVTLDNITEEFDFTGLPEGIAESIEVDFLPLNPVVKAEKIGEEVIVKLLRFYSKEEKHLFEVIE